MKLVRNKKKKGNKYFIVIPYINKNHKHKSWKELTKEVEGKCAYTPRYLVIKLFYKIKEKNKSFKIEIDTSENVKYKISEQQQSGDDQNEDVQKILKYINIIIKNPGYFELPNDFINLKEKISSK